MNRFVWSGHERPALLRPCCPCRQVQLSSPFLARLKAYTPESLNDQPQEQACAGFWFNSKKLLDFDHCSQTVHDLLSSTAAPQNRGHIFAQFMHSLRSQTKSCCPTVLRISRTWHTGLVRRQSHLGSPARAPLAVGAALRINTTRYIGLIHRQPHLGSPARPPLAVGPLG
eukprot:1159424-Pelagomonas_calceolata.AAC.1